MEKQNDSGLHEKQHKSLLYRLLGRMTVYYFALALLVALANWINPDFINHFPVGGLDDIVNPYNSGTGDLEDALLSADYEELETISTEAQQTRTGQRPVWFGTTIALFLAMTSAFLLMIPVSWVHKSIHQNSVYDHSLDETTLILPAVVAGIVTVVQHSLALAFSLAGIVAGVRFRRALSDTFDTLFIFVAIGVGIAAGIKSIEIAAVLTLFFNYATVLVSLFGDGLESQHLAREVRDRRQRKLEKKKAAASSKQP